MKVRDVVNLYDRDVAILKDYGIKRKLTLHKSLRKSGFEVPQNKRKKGIANDQKLDENIAHTRSRIFELAYCNPWEWFITLTIDPTKHDRHDLEGYMKKLGQWIQNTNKRKGMTIKYLLIPEMHEDGAWHVHGFLMGLSEEHLIKNKNGYLDWLEYREKFGYCSLDRIKNHEAVSKYVTKYISKNLQDCVQAINAHMYYCSNRLKRAQEIKRGTLTAINAPWDYENEWIKCRWSHESADRLGTDIL